MAGLRELRKRLRSIRTTEQVTNAMRTAASAKYAKVSGVRDAFQPYSDGCEAIMAQLGASAMERTARTVADRDCVVVVSGNRGLCGGFNSELFRYFRSELASMKTPPMLVACGKKAAAELKEFGDEVREFPISDIPNYDESRVISDYLRDLYVTGKARNIIVFYQKFRNMLTQEPVRVQLLPAEAKEGRGSTEEELYLPSPESIRAHLADTCFDSQVYGILLSNATGAQAATVLAMRNASDNAEEAGAKLELTINRRRQAEVTASVIETASGNFN